MVEDGSLGVVELWILIINFPEKGREVRCFEILFEEIVEIFVISELDLVHKLIELKGEDAVEKVALLPFGLVDL